MKSHFYLGSFVKLNNNPNAADIIYKIEDFNIYVDDSRTSIRFMLRPIKDFAHPEGGYYSTNNTLECKLDEVLSISELEIKSLVQ